MTHSIREGRLHKLLAMGAMVNLVFAACAGGPVGSGSGDESSRGPGATASAAAAIPTPSAVPTPSVVPTPTVDPYAGVTIEKVTDPILVDLLGEVGYLATTSDFVWAATSNGLLRIHPGDQGVDKVDRIGRWGVAASDDVVWAGNSLRDRVDRIEASSLEMTPSAAVRRGVNAVAILGDTVWVTQHKGGSVTVLDRGSGEVIKLISIGPKGSSGPHGVAATEDAVWIGITNTLSVVRIDPATMAIVANIRVTSSPCGGIAIQEDAVWVSSCFDDTAALRLDPATNEQVATINIGGPNGGAVLIGGRPWFPVLNHLVRIDPATNAIDRIVEFIDRPDFESYGTTIGFGSVWIGGNNKVVRIPIAALD